MSKCGPLISISFYKYNYEKNMEDIILHENKSVNTNILFILSKKLNSSDN